MRPKGRQGVAEGLFFQKPPSSPRGGSSFTPLTQRGNHVTP